MERILLFSYGTLRQGDVQLATYGRMLEGIPDVLAGHRLEPLAISDPDVIALSGKAVHTIARYTGNALDRIAGVVFELTAAELAASDSYEVDVYERIELPLESGCRAWVYIGPPLAAV